MWSPSSSHWALSDLGPYRVGLPIAFVAIKDGRHCPCKMFRGDKRRKPGVD